MFLRTCSACLLTGLIAAGLLAARPASAQTVPAQVTEYSDRASFTAASSGLTTLDFQTANISGGTLTGYATSAGLDLYGVNFVGTENGGRYTLAVTTPAYYSVYQGFTGNPTGLSAGDNSAASSPVITVTLPEGTTAVGTDLYAFRLGDGYRNTFEPVDFTLYSGTVSLGTFRVITYEKPTLAFAGFVSAVPITTVQVSGENDSIGDLSAFAFGASLAAAGTNPAMTNNGSKITITAAASVPDPSGNTLITVTTTNNGAATADRLQITAVTLSGVLPLAAPVSPSPVPTTLDLLAPGHSQINGFKFTPQPGTTHAPFKVSGTYIDTSTGRTGTFSASVRSLTLPHNTN